MPSVFYKHEVNDIVAAMRKVTASEPVILPCLCGCTETFVYAKDERALWIITSLGYDPDAINGIGLEDVAELDEFLDQCFRNGAAREHIVQLRNVFRPLFGGN